MKQTLFRPAALALFLVVLSPCAAAQEDPAVQEGERYVWTGRVLGEDGAAYPLVTELTPLQELAQIRLQVDVERDFPGALAALEDLQLRATQDSAKRMETLVQIARTRAELLERIGRVDEARGALDRLLIDETARVELGGRYELKLADAPLRIAEVRQLLDPRLVEVRSRLALQRTGDRGSAAGIERTVRDGLNVGNFKVVYDIGPRAVPALERILLESPDAFPKATHDPMTLLLELSELRGAALIVEHWDAGGFFWKKRIVRAMEMANVLSNEGTWQEFDDGWIAPRLLETGWLSILARLVHDPDVGRDALALVPIVAFNDALSPELQTGLGIAVRSDDPDLVREVLHALENTRGKRTTEAVAAAALDHPDEEVRRFACEHLLHFEPATALIAAADHEDPMVRTFAAIALTGRSIESAYYRSGYYSNSYDREKFVRPILGEGDLALLMRLAADADAGVRHAAVLALTGAPVGSVDAELQRRLAADPDPRVRARSVRLRQPNPQEDAAVLLVYTADDSPEVLEALDRRLSGVLNEKEESGPKIEPYLGVLAARRANAALAVDAALDDDDLWRLYASAVKSDAGVRLVAGWALDEGDDSLLGLLASEAAWEESDTWGANVGMACLDDERLAAVYARSFGIDRRLFEHVQKGAMLLQPPRGEALARILVDPDQPRALRLHAAWAAAEGGGAVYREQLLGFLREPGVQNYEPLYVLSRIPRELEPAERDALLLAVVEDERIPDRVGLRLFNDIGVRFSMDSRLAAPIVRRWYETNDATDVVKRALLYLEVAPGEPLSDRLVAAVRHPEYYEKALQNLGRLGHPEYLATLGQCLRADWVKDPEDRAEFQGLAVRALASYLTDEAAGYLLDGLVYMRDESVRAECFIALESIRRYQEERELWGRRKAEQRAREEALAQLLTMIDSDDPDARSHAVHSLAALGAVEQLPTVVKMLTDEHPMVRSAAQDALQALGGRRDGEGSGEQD